MGYILKFDEIHFKILMGLMDIYYSYFALTSNHPSIKILILIEIHILLLLQIFYCNNLQISLIHLYFCHRVNNMEEIIVKYLCL